MPFELRSVLRMSRKLHSELGMFWLDNIDLLGQVILTIEIFVDPQNFSEILTRKGLTFEWNDYPEPFSRTEKLPCSNTCTCSLSLSLLRVENPKYMFMFHIQAQDMYQCPTEDRYLMLYDN
ncbi:hypothetical protein DVH24_015439 [Malus domestica]|uniref:Uncharacterized protein n=1 Tax=Malus domestica TaxID=3750 RepID=A0A498HN28_MALDO|nr:hypothetical protein DVH24_015439 [Malus domestica]